MSATELREFDAWICQNVFGWKRGKMYGNGNGEWDLPDGTTHYWNNTPCFTTSASAAMEVLKKCAVGKTIAVRSVGECCQIVFDADAPHQDDMKAEAETLELAICLFAKRLFSK